MSINDTNLFADCLISDLLRKAKHSVTVTRMLTVTNNYTYVKLTPVGCPCHYFENGGDSCGNVTKPIPCY